MIQMDSIKTRLQSANAELERLRRERDDLEKSYQRDKEEWTRTGDKQDTELITLKDTNQVSEIQYLSLLRIQTR